MRRIAVIGLPFFAERTAEGLREAGFDAEYVPRPGRSPAAWFRTIRAVRSADLVYAIGSSLARFSPADLIAAIGKPLVMHWVGTDVQVARSERRRGKASSRLLRHATHWADAPWLAEELRTIGISAECQPLPVPLAIGEPAALPTDFRVLVYLPERPHAAYAVEDTLEVMRRLPAVNFTVVGGYQAPARVGNVSSAGFVHDMAAQYRQHTALLRLVHHDGMSHSVIEALSFGRYVVWNYPFPGVTQVARVDDAVAAVEDLHRRFTKGELHPNSEGIANVTERYRWSTIRSDAKSGVDRLLS